MLRPLEEIEPNGIVLPRPREVYETMAEFADQDQMQRAIEHALEDVIITPKLFADLMVAMETELVNSHAALVGYELPDISHDGMERREAKAKAALDAMGVVHRS